GACQCRPGLVMTAMGCREPTCSPACSGGTPLCASGTCVGQCPTNLPDMCAGQCVDFQNDPLHCGACDRICMADEVCARGDCRHYATGRGCTSCPCAACVGDLRACCSYGSDIICVEGDPGRCP
ncbi:MAG TPA: hypothetical protein VKN99_16745, partial [Polyangia bacterium]|nr:hypothetical protein [Polyangia bacterium]